MTTPPTTDMTVDQRRAIAAELARDGISIRAIGRQLRVHHTTISRDLAAAARTGAHHPADQDTPERTTEPDTTHQPAPPTTPPGITAVADTPIPPPHALPRPGDTITVTADEHLCQALAILTRVGRTVPDAIADAIHTRAMFFQLGWDLGYPVGVQPALLGYEFVPYEPPADHD
ncbi:helix-turn-helix domain-containing protein [Streptomyces sp. NPDC055025]